MADLIFVDCETTGLEPSADIWEFAGIRRRGDGISEQLHLFIEHSERKCQALPDAFRADHEKRYIPTEAVQQRSAADVIDAFTGRLGGDPPVVVGSAPDFDAQHIQRLMRRFGRKPEWNHQLIGVVPLMLGYLAAKGLPIPAHKSEDLSRACGVEPDDFERHTAMGDVLWTQAIFDCVMGADHA